MVTRSALPQNGILSPAAITDNCDSLTGWTAGGDATTEISLDSTYVKHGSTSIKMVVPTLQGTITKNITDLITASRNNVFRIWCYIPENRGSVYLELYQGNTYEYMRAIKTRYYLVVGWNCVTFRRSEFGPLDTAAWGKVITKIRLRYYVTTGSAPLTIYFDCIELAMETRSAVVMTFDDNFDSAYTEAFAYLESLGLKATYFVNSGAIGIAGRATLSQLNEIYAAGNALCPHTANHIHMPTLSEAAQEQELEADKAFWAAQGWNRSMLYFAHPFGEWNADTLMALENTGFHLAWGVVATFQAPTALINEYTIVRAGNIATLYADIDSAIAQGMTISMLYHDITEDGAGGTITRTEWRAIVDYLVSKNLEFITADEWYERFTNPRYRSLPVGRVA